MNQIARGADDQAVELTPAYLFGYFDTERAAAERGEDVWFPPAAARGLEAVCIILRRLMDAGDDPVVQGIRSAAVDVFAARAASQDQATS